MSTVLPTITPLPTDPLEYFETFVKAFADFGYSVKRNRRGDVHVQCHGACGASEDAILEKVFLEPKHLFVPDPDNPTIPPRVGSSQEVPTTRPAPTPAGDERFAQVVKLSDTDLLPGEDEEEEAAVEYDWEGVVAKGSIATLGGAKKAAKSWLQCLLMVSAAERAPVFPGLPWGGKRILLVSGPMENDAREIKRRIRAIRRQFGILTRNPGDGEIWALEYRSAVMRNDPRDPGAYLGLLEEVRRFAPDHVFLDSASALWGGKNENDNAEVRTWLEQRLVPLIEAAARDCTVYLAAHTGHVARVGSKVFTPEHQRGASAWCDATDTAIMVQAVDPPANAPDGTVAALITQKFTRLGEPARERLLLTISGGPRTQTPITVQLTRHDAAVALEGAPHPVRLRAYGDAHQVVKEAGAAGVFKVALHEALMGQGHRKTVAWAAIATLEGEDGHPHPSGVYRGQVVRLVRSEKRPNPKTKRGAAWLAYLPQDQLPAPSSPGAGGEGAPF